MAWELSICPLDGDGSSGVEGDIHGSGTAGVSSLGAAGVSHRVLSTREPPRHGLRPKSAAQGRNNSTTDKRFMALCLLPLATVNAAHSRSAVACQPSADEASLPQPECLSRPTDRAEASAAVAHLNASSADGVIMVTSSSDGALSVHRLDLDYREWSDVSQLQPLGAPVICLRAISISNTGPAADRSLPDGSNSCCTQQHLVLAGATNGCIGVWDLTVLHQHQQYRLEPPPSASKATVGCSKSSLPMLSPLGIIEGVHQSGINSLAVASLAAAQRIVVATGGDDQGLGLMILQLGSKLGQDSGAALQVTANF